jgi:chromosomal replication initiation ATPase DnaA
MLDKNVTFENANISEKNNFAKEKAKEVSEKLGTKYNPLIIYGDNTKEKYEILNSLLNNTSNKVITYVDVDELEKECDDYDILNNKYISADIFVLDNIEKLEYKITVQKRILFIYTNMKKLNKQMIFVSKKSVDLIKLDKRLRDRLETGLSVSVL